MTPELRAVADRFIYEQATVKHIAALAGDGALDRPVAGYEWTARQLLGHLAASLAGYAAMVERWNRGEPPIPANFDPDGVNAETAADMDRAPLAEILALFGSGLNRLVAALSAVPDQRAGDRFGEASLLDTMRSFGEHCLGHAIALVDALPEVRMDAFVLNWLLHAGFESPEAAAWQAALLSDARAYIASLPDDDEEDE